MPGEIGEIEFSGGRKFEVAIYDLLDEPTDCIVNAANGGLAHGGGVAAAIADAAGDKLFEECEERIANVGRIPTGGAYATTAGNLPFKAVIHAVGPRKGDGDEEEKIVMALHASFRNAEILGCKSLSFPAISSGIFAVPHDVCARAYIRAVREYFAERTPEESLKLIRLCLFQGPLVDEVLALVG